MSITNLETGSYQIFTLAERYKSRPPVGIDPVEGDLAGGSKSVRVTTGSDKWDLTHDVDNAFFLKIDGLDTCVIDGKVRVSSSLPPPGQRWRAIYSPYDSGFNIVLDEDQTKGWMVPADQPLIGAEIGINTITNESFARALYQLNRLDG